MSFSRPTLTTLIDRVRTDIQTQLTGIDPWLRWQAEGVLGKILAGQAHGLHGHLLWLSRQIMPDTADGTFLERWCDIFGITRIPAAQATGPITITGTPATVVPAGTLWQRADDVQYSQDADATIAGGGSIADVDVTAVLGELEGNADSGTTLTIVTPQGGVDTTSTVDSDGIDGGTDDETDAAMLVRLLARLRTPPKGGGPNDYVNWALEVSGATRAWEVANHLGPNTVGVWFVRDGDGSGAAIIPSAGEVATMQAYLDTVRPITVEVTAFAPTAVALDVTLTTLTPDTLAVQTAVETELADYVLRTAGSGVTHYISQINEAISLATGEVDHVMTVPAANIVITNSQILIEGSLSTPLAP